MKKIYAFILLIFIHVCATACVENIYNGEKPATRLDSHFICKKRFAIAYSTEHKIPLWVSERLTRKNLMLVEVPRRDNFRPDPAVHASQQASSLEYRSTGYDRGHLVPFENVADDAVAGEESFLFTNIVPQVAIMNRGVWKSIEGLARNYAISSGEVFVITGVLISNPVQRLKNGTTIPNALWKIIYFPRARKSVAFLVPNSKNMAYQKIDYYRIEVNEIEKTVGIKFNFMR